MSSLPPPLPPLSSAAMPNAAPAALPAPAAKKKLSGVAIGLIGVLACATLFGLLVMAASIWLIGTGWSMFADQARTALQADAVVQEHIGQIRTMRVDLYRTGLAQGGEEFVFNVEGDRGAGRVQATWVSAGSDQEILSDGELILRDGRRFALPAADDSDFDTETELDTDSELDTDTDTATSLEEHA
ncbi:hypothetical protein [Xanthomonas vesicatoria]|uniref:hypothetical protein n=1 Tax=Xanthomonas vesicatoria TaxID=56460 RepID=UPI001E4B74EC|nr:hypothetical protein [Xanthomonas vesicatoria]MCC8617895.1 hypothetical protein [Xanthomonas vesicatoria]MCC8628616.1 hypothetical protein [Xanthomonas vesicatoria]MCC8631582.1 hypothetical protein [Xanthomonas vesicatoria]MDG4483111.1 hypothetical protein [Xanthomonas vesicatoria]MDG4489414.1 hypothetical protein [Xanthomonas vesicatoria]